MRPHSNPAPDTARLLRAAVAGLVALAVLLLAACSSLPTSGPIVDGDDTDSVRAVRAGDIDPRPPTPGSTPAQVVTGFFEAMTAWPVSTAVARQYLTAAAAVRWKPERQTIVYDDFGAVRAAPGVVEVQLSGADGLDEAGSWRGALPAERSTLRLSVVLEDGEYRIADPLDALVVPVGWFQQRYRQVSLYFFDPLARVLVPEPVFVPAGDALATNLVAGLLAGPPPEARGIVRTFVPTGLSVGLSVPVDRAGVATVRLVGEAPGLAAEEAARLLAQLAWTLRQDPQVRFLRLSIGGRAVAVPGGGTRYALGDANGFDPAGASASAQLFGVSEGRLVAGRGDDLRPVSGPFGSATGIVSAAAAPDGERAAVVDDGGRRVQVGPVRADPAGAAPLTLLVGGRYARPTFDLGGRLWVLDRRVAGARVWLVEGGAVREVAVPGVSGTAATRLTVSRDGTRLVAVVPSERGDAIVGARVVSDDVGRVVEVRSPRVLRDATGGTVTDLAWSGPLRLAVLSPTVPGRLQEIDTVSADGSAVGFDGLSSVVDGQVFGVAAAPGRGTPVLAVAESRYTDVTTDDVTDVALPLTDLDYAG